MAPPDDVTAAGYTLDTHGGVTKPLLLHWDGAQWARAMLPATGRYSAFSDVGSSSDDDAWAVGADGNRALAMHWDGTTWTVESPVPPAGGLSGVDDVAADLAVTVGSYRDGTLLHLVWDGSHWR